MIFRLVAALCLTFALSTANPQIARADAGDFIGGAVVGGVVGYAIGKDQQKKKAQRSTTRTYRPSIPSTSQGAQTQTALNYFGYNAGRVDGQVGAGTRAAIQRYQASMGYPVNGYDFPTLSARFPDAGLLLGNKWRSGQHSAFRSAFVDGLSSASPNGHSCGRCSATRAATCRTCDCNGGTCGTRART